MADLDWEATHALSVFEKFRDYWIAQPGVKGRKSDWLATWRNWCRKESADEQKAVARNGGKRIAAAPNGRRLPIPEIPPMVAQQMLAEADEMLRAANEPL